MRSALPLILFAAACGSGTQTPVAPATLPTTTPSTATAAAPAPADEPPVAGPTKPVTVQSLVAVGLDPDSLDRTADPCEDFYQFACGGYIAKTEIPADKPIAMRSFVTIGDRNLEYEKSILETASTKPGEDPIMKQLGAFYGSCMNEPAIEKAGLTPIKPLLAQIDRIHDAKSLSAAVTQLHVYGINALFAMGPTQDSADATKMIADVDQGGLGLRDRDYYLKDDDQTKKVRGGYHDLLVNLLVDAGKKPDAAAKSADAIMALETEIAKVSKDKVARRDPKGMYNKIDRAGVTKAMPHFAWDAFWKGVGLATVKDVNADAPDFLSGVDQLIQKVPMATWRDYLTAWTVRSQANLLPKNIEDQVFAFRQVVSGVKAQEPRWKRCTRYTDGALGDLLGQAFVRDKFGGQSKQAAEEQVHAIVTAMTANLAALPWMDATTKGLAAAKLSAMFYQIGYPKKWRTYPFKLDPKTWGANSLVADKAETARQLAKVGKPVDKDDWGMTAPTVNAYYNPQLNGMVFPAGILQPPFYSVDAAIAVNMGGMGVVVGHELTHGFDDQGAQYDKDGNLKDWWQPETEKQFKQRTQCVIDQYSKYKISGVNVNGATTVGENIADIGGVKLALAGYRALRASAADTVVADGFTEDQQFFLGFGQAWCAKARPDYEKLLANLDVHSPAHWRVDGALSATPDFAKAFRCKVGSKMRPKNACVVW
ncbi:MAG: M13 family metallopeptidase [Kofleriaceae bacterium]